MADNTTLAVGAGGDVVRDKDRAGVKTQIVGLDVGIGGTEQLMSAAALADATANPTLPAWASMAMLYNGTTWDRMRGDTANGLDVDVTRLPAVTNAGTFATQDSEKVVDNAAFTDGTTKVQPAGYIFDETAGTALTENDAGAARMDSKRAVVGVIEDTTTRGQRATVTAANALKVDANQATAANLKALVDQGTAATAANAWTAKVTDGTNVAAVKAASTAAVAADPAMVVALSPNQNTQPNALYVKPRAVATYAAGFRAVVATASHKFLAVTFVANTDKQIATIHHLVGSTKTVRLRYVSITLAAGALTAMYDFELRRLGAATAPATGNPAITPTPFDSSDGAAEATCLSVPTTQGTDANADRPLSPLFGWNSPASVNQADPARAGEECVLYDGRSDTDGRKPLVMRSGVAEGYAVIGRSVSAVGINFTVFMEFTEE